MIEPPFLAFFAVLKINRFDSVLIYFEANFGPIHHKTRHVPLKNRRIHLTETFDQASVLGFAPFSCCKACLDEGKELKLQHVLLNSSGFGDFTPI